MENVKANKCILDMSMGGDTLSILRESDFAILLAEGEYKYNAPHKFMIINAGGKPLGFINIQEGPIKEVGVNGFTNEDLLTIVNERLKCFQESNFKCEENAKAMEHIKAAITILEERTSKRKARGVEGTNQI